MAGLGNKDKPGGSRLALWWLLGCLCWLPAHSRAGSGPGIPEVTGPVFSQPLAIQARDSYTQKKYDRAAELSLRALAASDLPPEERPYVLFLRFLALQRTRQNAKAEEALLALVRHGVPQELSAHLTWYQARAQLKKQGKMTAAQKRKAMVLLEKVPWMGRFARPAQSLVVRWMFSLDRLEEGCQRAAELVEKWQGFRAEAEALLLLGGCQERRARLLEQGGARSQAEEWQARAASVYQEIVLWWPASTQGKVARGALSGLRRRGLKASGLDEGRLLERAQSLVRHFRNRSTLKMLARIRGDLPRSASRLFGYELDLLTAQVAASLRDTAQAERIYRDVLQKTPSVDQRARAELGLARFVARESLAVGTGAYLAVERRWPGTSAAPAALFAGGELARKIGDLDSAALAFQRCVERYPDRPETASCVFGLGWLAWRNGFAGDARMWLEQLLVSPLPGAERAPAPNPEFLQKVRYWHARILEGQGEVEAAVVTYRHLAADHPYGYYALLSWERLAILKRDTDLASTLAAWHSASAKSPENNPRPHPEALMALSYARMGLSLEAQRTLRSLRPADLSSPDRRLISLTWQTLGNTPQSHRQAPFPREDRPGLLHGDLLVDARLAYPKAFGEVVEGSARAAGVPSALVFAMIRTESSFRPRAQSPARALGLTQVIQNTAEHTARALGLVDFQFQSLTDPAVSAQIGAAYLKELLRLFDGNLALAIAAYNAGTGSVHRWLTRLGDVPIDVFVEEIPYRETNRYVQNVLTAYALYRMIYDSPAGPPIGLAFDISRALVDRLAALSPVPPGLRNPG